MEIKLETLLHYENGRVVSRFQQDYPDAKLSAKEALSELMKYIWICLKHHKEKKDFPEREDLKFFCTIYPEMKEIDNMWHTFLLFTQDYQEFCNQYLNGIFFHHQPLSHTEKILEKHVFERELGRYLSYLYDNLGENTVKKWFDE